MSSTPTPETVQIYAEIGNYERHFNNVQSAYRGIASSWLLASFGAIGAVLTSDKPCIGLPPDLLVTYISLFSSIGLLLLWNLDVNVYHRLLVACFEAGLNFERIKRLPTIRSNMEKANRTVRRSILLFYFCTISIHLLIVAYYFFQRSPEKALSPIDSVYVYGLTALVVVAMLVMSALTFYKAKK